MSKKKQTPSTTVSNASQNDLKQTLKIQNESPSKQKNQKLVPQIQGKHIATEISSKNTEQNDSSKKQTRKRKAKGQSVQENVSQANITEKTADLHKLRHAACAAIFAQSLNTMIWNQLSKQNGKPASLLPRSKTSFLSQFVGIKYRAINHKKKQIINEVILPEDMQTATASVISLNQQPMIKQSLSNQVLQSTSNTSFLDQSIKFNASEEENIVQLLDLNVFKTQPCKNQGAHNPKKCLYYHESNKKDRRRGPSSYISEMCPHISGNSKKECPEGDDCIRCHNRVEDFYHPEKYKSKFCSTYPEKIDQCEYGEICAFAHHENELSVNILEKMDRDTDFYMFHFKTVWCPFSDKDHQRDLCVYAHNWQDYRRSPYTFEYSNTQCTSWETKKNTKTYKDGCKLEYRCGSCHGWKELEYHPNCYKTSECRISQGGKCRKAHCPYYHNEQEKRQQMTNGFFKMFPRNRGTIQSQVFQYQKHSLQALFKDQQRSQIVKQHHSQKYFYADQTVYGCGPQSIPIIDPRIVLEFQKSRLPSQSFDRTIGGGLIKRSQSSQSTQNIQVQTQQQQYATSEQDYYWQQAMIAASLNLNTSAATYDNQGSYAGMTIGNGPPQPPSHSSAFNYSPHAQFDQPNYGLSHNFNQQVNHQNQSFPNQFLIQQKNWEIPYNNQANYSQINVQQKNNESEEDSELYRMQMRRQQERQHSQNAQQVQDLYLKNQGGSTIGIPQNHSMPALVFANRQGQFQAPQFKNIQVYQEQWNQENKEVVQGLNWQPQLRIGQGLLPQSSSAVFRKAQQPDFHVHNSLGSNIWGSSALSDVQMPIDGEQDFQTKIEQNQVHDDFMNFSNSVLDDVEDEDSQDDNDELIVRQVVRNQNLDLYTFLIQNNLQEFCPLLSAGIKVKTVHDLQKLNNDQIRNFCQIQDFGANPKPTLTNIEKLIYVLRNQK